MSSFEACLGVWQADKVLYLDSDIVVTSSLLVPYLLALPQREVYLQSDERHFSSYGVSNFCTGGSCASIVAGSLQACG